MSNVAHLKAAPSPKPGRMPPRPKMAYLQVSDIVDLYRLFSAAIKQQPAAYPEWVNLTTDQAMSQLYHFMTKPSFFGVILRVGRKPMGYILGEKQARGSFPFLFLFSFYVDPSVRNQGIARGFVEEYFAVAKKQGFSHWETNAVGDTVKLIHGFTRGKAKTLFHRMQGEI